MRELAALVVSVAAIAPAAASQSIRAIRVTNGVSGPTFLSAPPGDTERLFVTAQNDGVFLIKHGLLQPTMFLDLSGVVHPTQEGLLGLAFHPDYASNGRFFVCYQDTAFDSYLVEYAVSADPDRADPGSAVVLRGPIPQPHAVHNWNCLQFGPDGMLYVGVGDGGPDNDPNEHGQDLGTLFGKLLRLDVDLPPPHVPPDNPFVGVPGAAPEIWAYGLREPWRFSFDRLTGDLFLADVGQSSWEEIDFQPAASAGGENYGWRCMEGTHCTNLANCACQAPAWVDPIHEYPHTDGRCCVIGGYVYRGAALPAEQGNYFFADFCGGRVWSFKHDGQNMTDFQERTAELAPCDGSTIELITSFGQDAAGELYVLDRLGGEVFKIVASDGSAFRYCSGAPNSAGPGAAIGFGGTTNVADNDFELRATQAVPGQFGLFYYGPNQVRLPFGDGFRCVGGATTRLNPPLVIDPSGSALRPIDFQSLPPGGQIVPGSRWNFQFWYRDPTGPLGSGFNLSDALSVAFCP